LRNAAVIRWLQTHKSWADARRLVIGGDSAGANLSVAACLALRDAGGTPLPRGMLLNYGAYDAAAANLADGVATPPEFTLTCEEMKTFWRNYLRGPADIDNPLANLLQADLRDLPPALMVIADCDTLYAENLRWPRFRTAVCRVPRFTWHDPQLRNRCRSPRWPTGRWRIRRRGLDILAWTRMKAKHDNSSAVADVLAAYAVTAPETAARFRSLPRIPAGSGAGHRSSIA
jgi:acetyl esterase/lipase